MQPLHLSRPSSATSDGPMELRRPEDLPEKAHAFLEKHGMEIHEILGPEISDSPPKTTFSRQTTLDESSLRHIEVFQEAVRIYEKQNQDKKSKALDLKQGTTWADVLELAADAEKAYQDASGKRIRKIGRWVTDKSEVALPYLRCIPNDPFYTNILSGGLRIAASRISEARHRVLETLLRIPDAIEQAERCVSLVPNDSMLYQRTLKVYLAALATIEGTVKWLRGTPKSKTLKSLFRGTLYTRPLVEKQQALEDALNALEEYLSTLHTELLVETGKSIESIRTIVSSTEQTGITIDVTTKKTLQHVKNIDSKFDASTDRTDGRFQSVEDSMKTLTQGQSEARDRLEGLADIEEAKKQAKEAIKIVLIETAKNAEWRKKQGKYIRSLKKEMRILQATAAAMTSDDMLQIIGANLEHRIFDLQSVSRTCEAADLTDYDMTRRIVEHAMLRNWLRTCESIGLFVDGGASMASYGRSVSPVSTATSTLVNILDEDPAVPIWFFCGAHDSPRDPLRGPQGIMRSLISQILGLFDIKLDFISTTRYRQQLEARSLYALCDCFTKLIRRIEPPSVIICVIDEICVLEKTEWAEGCRYLLYKLQALLDDEEVSVLFKLLVTSSSRSKYAAAMFPPDCQLKLVDSEIGRDEIAERETPGSSQTRSQRGERGGTIQKMRRRSHTVIWTDVSDSDPDVSEDDGWGFASPDGDGRSQTQYERTTHLTVVDRTVEIQRTVLDIP